MQAVMEKIKANYEKIFFCFFIIYLLALILGTTAVYTYNATFEKIVQMFRYMCYFVFVAKIIIDWKNGESMTWPMIISGITALFVSIFSGDKRLLFLLLILFSIRNINLEKLLKIALYVQIISLITIILFSKIGIFPDWLYERDGNLTRHAFGYNYTSYASSYLFTIALAFVYLKKEKVEYVQLVLIEIIAIILYIFTDTRLGFLLTTTLLLLTAIIKYFHNNKKVQEFFEKDNIQKGIKFICYGLIPILISIIIMMLVLFSYNTAIGKKLNQLFSKRLDYAVEGINNYGIHLFGNKIEWTGWGGYGYIDLGENFKYNFVDISYIKTLLEYGIFAFLLILTGYTLRLKEAYKEKDYWLILMLAFVLICSVIEPNIITIEKNLFVLSLASIMNYGKIKCLDYKNISKFFMKRKNSDSDI